MVISTIIKPAGSFLGMLYIRRGRDITVYVQRGTCHIQDPIHTVDQCDGFTRYADGNQDGHNDRKGTTRYASRTHTRQDT